jgi:ubiquinone/menaquinone biosynthesis C-methylase UbiE
MSWLLATVYDPWMRKTEDACLAGWREELLSTADGDVLEIGAGTGANVPHYPTTVDRLVLAEPDASMRGRLERRIATATPRPRRVETAGASVDALPFSDASFDVVVSTLVLCSVPDLARALAEARRVLRPGGRLLFIEHVAAEEGTSRLVWQRRIEPAWRLIAGDCHVTRRTGDAICAAGFRVERETRESVRKALPWVRPSIRGVAVAPS